MSYSISVKYVKALGVFKTISFDFQLEKDIKKMYYMSFFNICKRLILISIFFIIYFIQVLLGSQNSLIKRKKKKRKVNEAYRSLNAYNTPLCSFYIRWLIISNRRCIYLLRKIVTTLMIFKPIFSTTYLRVIARTIEFSIDFSHFKYVHTVFFSLTLISKFKWK